ncbi:MAG: phosphocholine cytidylyltransferase family protein, partial [Nitrospira sp.]|nr:phosphocholine cytidylyltransferase family protein [Nitrospira sp.]
MKAVILAAGVGKRLGKQGQGLPKCMVQIGGRPLLARTLTALDKVGIKDRVVVAGYEKEKIEHLVNTVENVRKTVRLRVNPDYRKGSILSLWCARDEFNDDLLIMDADVLYADALLSKLVFSSHPNALLLDPRSNSTGEEMMLMVRGNRVVHIGRKVEGNYDLIGEGVGFLKLSRQDAPVLKEALEQLVKEGKEVCEYEDAIELLIQKVVVGYESVGSLAWTEIDFPEDIQKAETEI